MLVKKNEEISTEPYYLNKVTSERKDELLDKLANKIIKFGLDLPAIIFLETLKPLAFVGGQLLWAFGSPFLDAFDLDIVSDYLMILQNRANISHLVRKIDDKKFNLEV